MNQDENQTSQQGYGQDPTSKDLQEGQPQGRQQQQQPQASGETAQQGGAADFSTGQASYGNSGQAELQTQSQNSSDMGQEADMGQSGGSQGSGFIGSASSGDDLGSSSDQDFAEQGQGALNEDLMGSDQEEDDDLGTTDIETERSQGREPDIEGSAL